MCVAWAEIIAMFNNTAAAELALDTVLVLSVAVGPNVGQMAWWSNSCCYLSLCLRFPISAKVCT